MELERRERARVSAPVKPFMDLDVGEFDIRGAALSAVFVFVALLVALLAAVALRYSFTRDYWNFLSGGFALLVALLACWLAYGVGALTWGRWCDHRERLRAWHEAGLNSYVNSRGVIEAEEITEYSFSADNPLHVLWVALDVQRRVDSGEDTPYSARALRGPMFFAGRRVGELSKQQAERMSARLAALSLIEGRREGYAGRWRASGADMVVDVVRERWRA